MKKRWLILLLVLVTALAACGTEPEVVEVTRVVTETEVVEGEVVEVTRVITETVVETVTEVETVTQTVVETVTVEVEAEQEPVDRNGSWIDTLVVVEDPNPDSGVTRLLADDIDVYAFSIAEPETVARINENSDQLVAGQSYGSYNEIFFNPVQECDDGTLNPFGNQKMREAMNWLVDRDFIIQEYLGGLGAKKILPIGGAAADRAKLAAEIRAMEVKYAHDPERAAEVINAEMPAMGAELVDGIWTYNGEPVEITIVIRTEDERREYGDYFGNLLEDQGFAVIRDYKTSAEASPIWLRSEPSECLWQAYTGGWSATAISLDDGANFDFFYTTRGLPFPPWLAFQPSPELDGISQRLANNDFASVEERAELMAQVIPLALENSQRIFLYDQISTTPWRQGIEVSTDLAGGVYGSAFWPYTIRRTGEVGGSMTWAMPSILTEPWNPLYGSNWIYDQSLIRALSNQALYSNPTTGLNVPQRIESAVVTVQEDLPVGQSDVSQDWLTLETAPTIEVPADAWADWDAENQVFITTGERFTETATAQVKVTTVYPADLYDTVTWHDGSPIHPADFVMFAILYFDQGKEASPYYDEGQVPTVDNNLATLKGFRITSLDPLTVEWYSDLWFLQAEENVTSFNRHLWPFYSQGEGPWHTIALGLKAEGEGLLAYSADKSTANEIEWTNFIAGPSLQILADKLAEALETNYIPYEPTLSQFLTEEEIAARYANLQNWYDRRGHFWIGTGPFFLQRAFPVEGTIILEHYPDYPDPADKWSIFSEPRIAEVEVDGPGRVTIGEEATYDIFVDFKGEAYPMDDIESVSYLVFDATGNLVEQGTAEAVDDGLWQTTLSADLTSALEAGSNSLEVVVVSKLLTLPSFSSFEFVSAP